jgi:hypothetical protein
VSDSKKRRDEGDLFYLQPRISKENGSENMMQFMHSDKNMKEMIQTSPKDRIEYRIIQEATPME